MFHISRMNSASLPLFVALAVAAACWQPFGDCAAYGADDYAKKVAPFVRKYCFECHAGEEASADLDLSGYAASAQVVRDFRHWNHVIEFLRDGEMPPAKAKQPEAAERDAVVAALREILLAESRKWAGDPGVTPPRRLSNTEYDLSIRDLTGVDIRPTAEFPPDPAAGEGFDNTAEALSMSPSLLKKYLAAAQQVSQHLVLRTDGVSFAPFPVTSYNERKKLTEQAIIDFYTRHEVHIAEYLEAAWRYRHRGKASADIASYAAERGLSGRYLSLVFEALERAAEDSTGYSKDLGDMWRRLPPPEGESRRPAAFEKLVLYVEFLRETLGHKQGGLIRSNAGNWPISHLDFRAREAMMRDRFDAGKLAGSTLVRFDRLPKPNGKGKESENRGVTLRLRVAPAYSGSKDAIVVAHRPLLSNSGDLPRDEEEAAKHEAVTLRSFLERHAPEVAKRLAFGRHPRGGELDADSFALAAPALVEIPFSEEMLERLQGKHLLFNCELDLAHSPEAVAHVQHAVGDLPEETFSRAALLVHPKSRSAEELAAAAERFCHAFPNGFFYVDGQRGLAAGFHLVEGFFRDDRPLVEKVLSETERGELDELWRELHFVTRSAETLLQGFVWFEVSERHVLQDERFDFVRAEDPRILKPEILSRFEREYLGKLGVKLKEDSLEPVQEDARFTMIHGFFEQLREGLALHRTQLEAAEREGLADLKQFAERAYRRPLRPEEWSSLEALFSSLRSQGQSVEDAIRGQLTAVLMSPEFLYHVRSAEEGPKVYPLSDHELASRLSYFLWSSIPDEELLAAASAGRLQQEEELLRQTRRMLADPRSSALAREFFGQWLRYRDFLEKDPINAPAFPGYDERLRQAMFEEPTRLIASMIQNDRPITDLLNSDATYVNGRLAEHYGGEILARYRAESRRWEEEQRRGGLPQLEPSEVWHRVEGLRSQGRGGLFGMAIVLTKNSSGERTSPVKRGFWTVHHLLGKHFPPPPAEVPELPLREKDAEKTIRELIAEHTAHAKCALCHTHFDFAGMAMEGFDAIGRARTHDSAGRLIDNLAAFPNGQNAEGVSGLIEYVENQRREEFLRTFCRKFLGYALGRSVLLSDEPLLNSMQAELAAGDYRFSHLFETVVRSPQFRMQRGRDFVTTSLLE